MLAIDYYASQDDVLYPLLIDDEIRACAHRHFATLVQALVQEARHHFEYINKPEAIVTIRHSLKTHFGNNEDFWYPLFEHIIGRPPVQGRLDDDDDPLWDEIIPRGFRALKEIRDNLPHYPHLPLERYIPLYDRYKERHSLCRS